MLFYLTLIFCCQLLGELIVAASGMPIPGPVAGMVILFAGLAVKGAIPDDLQSVGNALLANLSLLFVPAGTGVMVHFTLLKNDGLAVSTALVGSTVITIAVTALVLVGINRWQNKPKADGQ
jgi:holin-like protein